MTNINEDEFWLPYPQLDVFDTDARVERCAILLGKHYVPYEPDIPGRWEISTIAEVPNRSSDPQHGFAIHLRDMREVQHRYGGDVLGCLHTHYVRPSYPSMADLRSIPRHWLGVVYHPHSRTVTFYNYNGFILEVRR